jgi:hypothetical protein
MADKTIGSLPEATELDSESLLVTEQLGEARRVTGELLAEYAKAAAQEEAEKAGTYAQNAAESAQTAEAKAQEAQNVATKPPYIQGETWWIWNEDTGTYTDSGIDASVSLAIADTVTGAPGTNALVENIGTTTDLLLRFTIPRGDKGDVGSVNSVNSKTGDVTLQAQDIPSSAPSDESEWTNTQTYLEGLHAREKTLETSKGQPGGLATLTSVGKLSQMPTASDVGARPNTWTPTAEETGAIPSSEKGAAGGVATLGANGKIVPMPTPADIGLPIAQGTWTPTLIAYAGSTAPTVSYIYQNGVYYRIGDLVMLTFRIRGAVTNIGNGYAGVGGIPVPAYNTNMGYLPVTLGSCSKLVEGSSATTAHTAVMSWGDTPEIVIRDAAGQTALKYITSTTSSYFELSGTITYIAADSE